MKFCTKCGTQLHENDIFCTKCGNKIILPDLQEKNIDLTNDKEELIENINNQKEYSNKSFIKSKSNKKTGRTKAYICPIIIGVVLILVGIFIQVPGGVLTTYEFLDGDKTHSYVFDDKYTAIDEYIVGDAYNYIIGASLIAGKISGTMTTKAIFIVSGILCLCFGITLKLLSKNDIKPQE